MATWQYKVTAVQPWTVASSGTKIYVLQYDTGFGGDDIYEYNPATNDWALIVDISVVDADVVHVVGMVWFNGDLYFAGETAEAAPTNDELRIYRWDGTPDDVTLVDTISLDEINFGRLVADGSVMVAYVVKPADDPGSAARYTADGSSWNNGSFSTYVPREPGNTPWSNERNIEADYPQGLYVQCCTDHSGSDTTRDTLFIWNTNTLTPVTVSSFWTYYGGDPVVTDWLWTASGGYYSTDFLVNRVEAVDIATHCHQINMPWQPGLTIDTYTILHQHDGAGGFDVVETFSPGVGGWVLTLDLDAWMVRLDNGMVYFLDTETGVHSGAWVILERSEPLSPPAAFAEFWQGTNGPGAAKKSDLPFTGINNPSCMVVRDDAAVTVFIGGADTGGEMVVSGTNADDYAAWADISGSLDTAKPINGLVSI